jgi:hypothetical protein
MHFSVHVFEAKTAIAHRPVFFFCGPCAQCYPPGRHATVNSAVRKRNTIKMNTSAVEDRRLH